LPTEVKIDLGGFLCGKKAAKSFVGVNIFLQVTPWNQVLSLVGTQNVWGSLICFYFTELADENQLMSHVQN